MSRRVQRPKARPLNAEPRPTDTSTDMACVSRGLYGLVVMLFAVLLMVDSAAAGQVAGAPVRFETAKGLKQAVEQVEPHFPPDIVAANPGAVLAANVVVRADGRVESVSFVTGPSALERPFVEALRQ